MIGWRRRRWDRRAGAAPPGSPPGGPACWCCICGWQGDSFEGVDHSESATCPRCGSIARDRFLFWCFVQRTPLTRRLRVLETSPRLDDRYRSAMARWFDYTASDFDERAHRGSIHLDLQDIALPDSSVDVVLTPHVLEHVPDTARALTELRRILAPGGRFYLQIPLLQARTAPPSEPEFHGDDTPVFWRFGWDLTEQIASAGFDVAALAPDGFDPRRVGAPIQASPEFDLPDLLDQAPVDDLVVVADTAQTSQLGFVPSYMFVTWEAVKPATPDQD